MIAAGVATRQAREHGHAVGTELRVLALHGLLHLLGYDHETDEGRMARAEARLQEEGRPALGPDRPRGCPSGSHPTTRMTPLLLFLLGCAATYLGTVTAAFSALMRLSLRIMAEGSGRDDRLGRYLDDPRRLFIPARLLLGIIPVLATALLARVTGVDQAGFPLLVLSIVGVRALLRARHPAASSSGAIPSACSTCCCRRSTRWPACCRRSPARC